jgi:hypothetical protein
MTRAQRIREFKQYISQLESRSVHITFCFVYSKSVCSHNLCFVYWSVLSRIQAKKHTYSLCSEVCVGCLGLMGLCFFGRGTGQQVPEFQRRLEWLNTPPLQLKKVYCFYHHTSRECTRDCIWELKVLETSAWADPLTCCRNMKSMTSHPSLTRM